MQSSSVIMIASRWSVTRLVPVLALIFFLLIFFLPIFFLLVRVMLAFAFFVLVPMFMFNRVPCCAVMIMFAGVSSSALPVAARMVIALIIMRGGSWRLGLLLEETPLMSWTNSPRLAAATVRIIRTILIHAWRVHMTTWAAQEAKVFAFAHTDTHASSVRIASLLTLFA